MVNNMEVGPCHRVVSVNKKLHFTSSLSTDMQQRRHTTRGNPEINPIQGGRRRERRIGVSAISSVLSSYRNRNLPRP